MTGQELSFEADAVAPSPASEASLIIDVEGFEGPLDLLLNLARQQKVDLARISILALAEQYLEFVDKARSVNLELAADYLVMAAWLAYLKSRLLIPQSSDADGPSAADMAAALAFRLRRLEAIRKVAGELTNRPQLGREVFGRGLPEPVEVIKRPEWSATLYDLLSAYAVQRRKTALSRVRFAPRAVWSLAEARQALQRLIGVSKDWSRLDHYLIQYVVEPSLRASAFASSLAATLELVREGVMELHQSGAFAPIYLRKRDAAQPNAGEGDGAAAGSPPETQH